MNVAIGRWESEVRFLEEQTRYRMEDAGKRFNILMIALPEMRKKALEDYTEYGSYLLPRQHLLEQVVRENDEPT